MFLKYFFILMKNFGAPFKFEACVLFLMSFIGGLLELIGIAMIFPVMMVLTSSESIGGKAILDYCARFFPKDTSSLKIAFFLSLAMIFVFLFKNIFMMFLIWKQNNFVKKWADYVNYDVVRKLLFAPYKAVKSLSYGDKNTLLYSIVRDISLDFVLRCIILLANATVALFITGILFYKFTIPAFLSITFILVYVYFENSFFRKKAKALGDICIKLLNKFGLDVNFIIETNKEISISGKQEYFANYLLNSSSKISDNMAQRISFGNYPVYVTEIGVILSFLIMIVSIVTLNDITKAEIVSSLAVIALIVLRLVPQLNKVLISMYTINVSKQNVIWFLEKYEEISKFGYEEFKNAEKMPFNDCIELKNLSFFHNEENGIKNINIKIKKGEFIGIIGTSGSGKTTLVDIISGIYTNCSGDFLVDNTKITRNNILSWQKNISILPQEPKFLNDSILKNIAFGEERIDKERAKEALIKAGIEIDLNLNPNELSVGQKHRVALARAYYRDFEILILDEATSALDSNSENIVMENILKLKSKKTVISVAHRISTLKNFDRIIFMEHGKISDIGSYSELKERNANFQQMLKHNIC